MPKTSILQDKDAFRNAAEASNSKVEMLKKLGLRAAGGNFGQLHKYSKIHKIELPDGTGKYQTRNAREANKLSYDLIFCENSTVSRQALKRAFGEISKRVCSICEIDKWNGKPLVVQIDHINGVHNDNRRENLRWLCPNCHSQTETFCAKNLVAG